MKTILTAIDFSEVTPKVGRLTEKLALAFEGCKVCLVHVAPPEPDFVGYDPGPQTVRDKLAEQFREEHRKINKMRESMEGKGLDVTALLIQGATIEKILEEIDRCKADLVVMGSHGHGALHQLLVGSVSEGVLRQARCPVLLVPSRQED